MIMVKPIAIAKNDRAVIEDDHWEGIETRIILDDAFPIDALDGIEEFSHLEVLFHFHKVDEEKIIPGARHPRNDERLPKVGIFAQRGKNRPNRIGLTTVKLLKREGRILVVAGMDCIDGTPVIDIKPVMKEFLPKGQVRQPAWVDEIMRNYW
ncbi:tRNA (N6-threonylcarbamoyladenosine(37)-N6)-methyltransferase TrmO [Bacillus tianshenii]|uniref:tRNA (N6-threonylcarbamoyladenosine(37)-N6)-methyltransferase TrmO n=1 Tax=Sutcliffiella tianshenii TaxID=1463404 RepID=UPI001CD74143|nr:tRNA (N6-threonylcarbamoyladenosine(37)-N6)-methyltransferase TrmO [Bacillus tianshenii]MCA1321645.1 tRNA (N6-threonylcarbamoyladenosine(37)-N6)-methyltransferase TrmO [Bacillus tianshenii]